MTQVYLVASKDVSITHLRPFLVEAESAELAIQAYQLKVAAKHPDHRDWVLDLAVNMSFAEQFYLATKFEQDRFDGEQGVVGVEPEVVRSRIKTYFLERPDLGAQYLAYMDTQNEALVTDEMLEFIGKRRKTPPFRAGI